MKKIVVLGAKLLCLSVGSLAISLGWFRLIREFRPAKLASAKDCIVVKYQDGPICAELVEQLRRPLSYFSCGGQSFVFLTENGRYLVKFFRSPTKRHPWRLFFRKWALDKKGLSPQEKANALWKAAIEARLHASDLTGLVYLHFPSEEMLPKTELVDCLGRKHLIDLNTVVFAVQKKAEPFAAAWLQAYREGDQEALEQYQCKFITFLEQRASRCLRNSDTKISSNFGLMDGEVIEWDFGNYIYDEKLRNNEAQVEELERFEDSFWNWIQTAVK